MSAEGEAGFGGKTMARKNVKGLVLKKGPAAPPPRAPLPDPTIALSDQLGSLEIGIEFKLDLRAEELQEIGDLGAGNGGTVSKVMHSATKTIMARKVIRIEAEQEARKKIVRELQIMHDCHSPYIVSFYGAFLSQGNIVMCMEYMDCSSLDTIAKRVGPIRIDVLGKIAEAVVEGLNYLYSEHRILHRDIKPSNILANSRGQIKLCDFGVSGELSNSLADTFVGTQTYMAPERILGASYSVKSDVWSLGLTLLELAIGRFPFESDDGQQGARAVSGLGILDLLQRIVNEPPPKLPESDAFPKSLHELIDHCLRKEPADRASLSDLLRKDFMRRAKATPVDLAAWAQSTLDTKQRQSLNHRLSTHVARQAPSAPTHARGSSRTGSVSERGGSSHPSRSSIVAPPAPPATQRRPSQVQALRMPSERQSSISGPSSRNSSINVPRLHTPDGSENSDYDRRNEGNDYDRRSNRDDRRSNGLPIQGHPPARTTPTSTLYSPPVLAGIDNSEDVWESRR